MSKIGQEIGQRPMYMLNHFSHTQLTGKPDFICPRAMPASPYQFYFPAHYGLVKRWY
jgi:hypothetical protein